MRNILLKTTAILVVAVSTLSASAAFAYNFGDFRSVTLTTKAWKALEEGDLDAVLAYVNKNMELYTSQAKKMQEGLVDYPKGTNDEIFSFWALNDIATSLFIKGEAYRKANMMDEAKKAYQELIDNYSYGQTWDTRGWFWKPAEAAQQTLKMIETGTVYDFGDYSSQHLVTKAWEALSKDDLEGVLAYVKVCLDLYAAKAQEMQNSLTEYPWQSNEEIFSYWALNDVGTALFIQAEAYRKAGQADKAKESYQKLIDRYYYAQCWDPNGWFWKPAEAAQENMAALGS